MKIPVHTVDETDSRRIAQKQEFDRKAREMRLSLRKQPVSEKFEFGKPRPAFNTPFEALSL